MTTTLITDEYWNHKLAAVFHSGRTAQTAAQALISRLGLGEAQVQLVAPGEAFPGRKLEPESQGILRTIVVSHIRLGIAGAVFGLLAFATLYVLDIPFIVQSPVASGLVIVTFCLFGGMSVGGLLALRPDHDRYIQATRDAMRAGDTTVVVHAFSRAQQSEAASLLREQGADVTSTL